MKIELTTSVPGNYLAVMNRFDIELFKYLTPPFPKVKIHAFTGTEKGDSYHIEFLFPMRGHWKGVITDRQSNDQEAYFIDEGNELPLGLSYWHHKHIVRKETDTTSLIIDQINFRGSYSFLTPLLYPMLYMAFRMRKPLYKKYFNALEST